MREEKIHKVPITELLPITCSFSLPLREVSGSTQGCVSWKEHLKSGPPQLIEREEVHMRADFPALTYGDRGNLGVKVQHPVAIHIDQVIASALFIIAEKVHRLCILGESRD